MKVLLDENLPLPLYHRLRAAGHDAEHIIVLGQRGIPDSAIRQRLMAEELVFLTNDTEFEDLPADYRARWSSPAFRSGFRRRSAWRYGSAHSKGFSRRNPRDGFSICTRRARSSSGRFARADRSGSAFSQRMSEALVCCRVSALHDVPMEVAL